MPLPEIVITLGGTILTALATVSAEQVVSGAIAKGKERLERKLGRGKFEEIQRALDHARSDVLAQCETDHQRSNISNVLDTCFSAHRGPLLDEFSAQVTQLYIISRADPPPTNTLTRLYRQMSGPVAIIRGEVPDDTTLEAIFHAFFNAFRERLLQEKDFAHLREYAQLVAAREQLSLQQDMVEHLGAIRANTAHPVDDMTRLHREYAVYIINELKDHTLRGFAPQVGGRVLSLPLAQIFLPLQAIEGRPALATYAADDLRQQGEVELRSELDQQRYRVEVERRYAQLSARLAAQRTLKLADLLQEARAVLLGDPGSGKTTVTRYIAYAIAANDTTHIGMSVVHRTPIIVRVALYAQAFEHDPTLHLVDYIERHLLPRADLGRYLRAAIEDGACLIMLDGLDEVANPTLRGKVMERIRSTIAAFSANHFLVTSRIVGYDQSSLTRDFSHATLQALTVDDQARFVRLWYAAIANELGDNTTVGSADEIISALNHKPQISRIAANPLLLTIIMLMHWRGVKLPNRRVQVYENATDTLIQYWTSQRGVDMDAEEVKAILGPIAHFILSRSVGGVISYHELLPQLASGITAQRGCDANESKRLSRVLLQDLSEQSGLFLARGQDDNQQPVYGFLHQTFGEYLAALHLAHQIFDGTFLLANYIHRAVWREPLLLLSGHLAIVSQPHANQLIRNMLDFPARYDEILQRNVLLVGECLADDVHMQPELRQRVLDALAQLIHHDVPQVRDAVLVLYQRLGQSRQREAAIQSLKRIYDYDDTEIQLGFRKPVGLNVAIVLLHLRERALAQPIIWEWAENANLDVEVRNTARRLRCEFWPEDAAAYLRHIITRARLSVITVGPDLIRCTLGPLDAAFAQRVLTSPGLLEFLNELPVHLKHESDRWAVQWIGLLAASTLDDISGSPALIANGVDLTALSMPAYIRCLAATWLLNTTERQIGIAVLLDLIEHDYGQAVPAAQALLDADAHTDIGRQILRDTAMTAQHYAAPQAIAALLQLGDTVWGISAAIHLLSTCQPGGIEQRDHRLHTVLGDLFKHGQTTLGKAIARWLALRPGYRYRIDACELLLEYGQVEGTIPLLHILAYECHDDASQRACQHLLILKEADLVVPLLGHLIHAAAPTFRYQAALALALADEPPLTDDDHAVHRTELKVRMLKVRQIAYREALGNVFDQGIRALDALILPDNQSRELVNLAKSSIHWLFAMSGYTEPPPPLELTSGAPPVVQLNAALFDLRYGAVTQTQQRLIVLLNQETPLSTSVRVFTLLALAEAAGFTAVTPFTVALTHPNATVRWAGAQALSGRDVTAARASLLRALSDESSSVRFAVVRALGTTPAPEIAGALIDMLADSDEGVRDVTRDALIQQGKVAVPLLLAVARASANPIRGVAVDVLARLHDELAADFFIVAMRDPDPLIRSHAAHALGFMADSLSKDVLLSALKDPEPNVRASIVEALTHRHDEDAIPHIHALISSGDERTAQTAVSHLVEFGTAGVPILLDVLEHAEPAVQASATHALGKLHATVAIPALIAKLTSNDPSVRIGAASALGQIGDRQAVPPLITTLRDNHSLVVEAAASALGVLGDPAAQGALTETLVDRHHFGRRTAAKALGALGDPAAIPTLLAMASDEDADVRAAAVEALAGSANLGKAEVFVACLADNDQSVRSNATAALGELGDQDALEGLLIALTDEASNVRAQAARALKALGNVKANALLLSCFLDPEEHVRAAIAEALGSLRVQQANLILTTAMLPDHPFAISELLSRVIALIHIDPEAARAMLDEHAYMFRGIDWLRLSLIGHALRQLGRYDEAIQHFQEALTEERDASQLLSLGHCYIELGDLESAAIYIQEVMQSEPENSEGITSQAAILELQGRHEEAALALRRAQAIDSKALNLTTLQYDQLWGKRALAGITAILTE